MRISLLILYKHYTAIFNRDIIKPNRKLLLFSCFLNSFCTPLPFYSVNIKMHIQPPTACNNTPSINMPNNYLLYYCGLQFILIIHGFIKQYEQNTLLRFQQICLSSYKNITIRVIIFLI